MARLPCGRANASWTATHRTIARSNWNDSSSKRRSRNPSALNHEPGDFGLTVSSSWGNGHATIWRGLIRALVGSGHRLCSLSATFLTMQPIAISIILPAEPCAYTRAGRTPFRRARGIDKADAAIVTSYQPGRDRGVGVGAVVARPCASSTTWTRLSPSRDSGLERAFLTSGRAALADFDLVLD